MFNRTIWGLLLLLIVVVIIIYYYGKQEGFLNASVPNLVVGTTADLVCPILLQSLANSNQAVFNPTTGILQLKDFNGNLVWQNPTPSPTGLTGVTVVPPYQLVLGANGILWIQDSAPMTDSHAVWSSTSPTVQLVSAVHALSPVGAGGPYILRMQDDGILAIFDKNNAIAWSAPTTSSGLVDTCLTSTVTTCPAVLTSLGTKQCKMLMNVTTGVLTLMDGNGTVKWKSPTPVTTVAAPVTAPVTPVTTVTAPVTYALILNGTTGDLYIQNSNGVQVWKAPTSAGAGAPYQLVVSSSCNLTLYDKNATSIWTALTASDTGPSLHTLAYMKQPQPTPSAQPNLGWTPIPEGQGVQGWNPLAVTNPYNQQMPSVSPTDMNSTMPQRMEITPDTNVSETTATAASLQKKSNFLKEIQKMIHNEFLSARSTNPIGIDDSADVADVEDTVSTMQGKEYGKRMPDMTQYIRKDSIPCAGCTLDY